jgi:hypothetical protein
VASAVADRFGVDVVSAEVVGRAAAAVVRSPESWAQFGSSAEVLQLLKYVWHILVLRGE